MSKITQNLVVLMKVDDDAYTISCKGGNMILNRFCIDEEAAFELSGVYSFVTSKKRSDRLKTIEKGKEYSF